MNDSFSKIFACIASLDIDALFLSSASARYYSSKLDLDEGYVLITKEKVYVIADFRYIEAVKKNKDICPVLLETSIEQLLFELCSQLNIEKLGFEQEHLTVAKYFELKNSLHNIELIASDHIISNLRMSKNEYEIEMIKKAQGITDAVFEHMLGFIRPEITERQMALEIDTKIRELGGDCSAFSTIALTGKNTSMPHGVPSDEAVKQGDFVLLDFGAQFSSYKSDMTRVVAVGNASEEMKKVYSIVLDAQNMALSELKAGMIGSSADKIARDYINKNGYQGTFGHSLGHGVGLDIHERPNLSPKYESRLPINSVVSVEPGIYLENKFGVRIEDLVVLKENSNINLTTSPKKLIIL